MLTIEPTTLPSDVAHNSCWTFILPTSLTFLWILTPSYWRRNLTQPLNLSLHPLGWNLKHSTDGTLQGFVLDGFPLDLEQAQAFERDIGSPKAIIFIEANDTVLEERLLGRGNFDDNKASIEKRLQNFYTKTVPVVEHYGDLVKRINAERPKEEVFADVQKVMESL